MNSPVGIVLIIAAVMSSVGSIAPAAAVSYSFGDVFAGVGDGKVDHYTSTGTLLETLDTTTGSSEQTGMCFDDEGNLYTTDFTAGKMSRFDKNGVLLDADWGGPFSTHPETCVFDGTNVYVGEVDGTDRIIKHDKAGNVITTYSPAGESRGTDWMDLAADKCTMYYTSEGSSVKRFDVCTNTQLSDFANGLTSPCFALRIRAISSEVMVACANEVYRLDSGGSVIQTYPKSGFTTINPAGEPSNLFAMNIDPDGTSFWTGGFTTGNIYKVDIASGVVLGSFTAAPQGPSMAGLAIFGERTVSNPEVCNDGRDNDGDGLVDSADPDCREVGGELLPVDRAALFVAGTTANAAWIFSVLTGIAAGIIGIAKLRAKKDH